MRTALVLGAGGFIGSHLVRRLKDEDFWVRGWTSNIQNFPIPPPTILSSAICAINIFADKSSIVDLMKYISWPPTWAAPAIFLPASMTPTSCIIPRQSILTSSTPATAAMSRIFSTRLRPACIPRTIKRIQTIPIVSKNSAYPANPDSEYGWEKLFSERLYLAYNRNYGMNCRVARFHNIFGPEGTWTGGREKAPAAICRKVASARNNGTIEIWGDGKQTRSFLYIDECLEGVVRLMRSSFTGPVNIGSEEMVTINQLADMVIKISGKRLSITNVPGPMGVRGRRSDNRLIKAKLGWEPSEKLVVGIEKTYAWINKQVFRNDASSSSSCVQAAE